MFFIFIQVLLGTSCIINVLSMIFFLVLKE